MGAGVLVLLVTLVSAQTPVTDKAIDEVAEKLAASLMTRWQDEIESLTSPDLVALFSKQTFDADTVSSLHAQYRAALKKPPHPDDDTYTIENGAEALKRTGCPG